MFTFLFCTLENENKSEMQVNNRYRVQRLHTVNNIILSRQRQRKNKRAAAVALVIAASSLIVETSEKTERRWWVRPWLEEKNIASLKLAKQEFQQDPEQFKKFLRMSEQSFDKLLQWLKPHIEKSNTNFRDAISAKDKLIITLRFLATGETYRSLMYSFRVSESTISLFVPEVCRAIYNVLKDDYLKV